MDENNSLPNIVFSENIISTLSDILKKYNLDENDSHIFDELSEKKSAEEIIMELAKQVFEKNIQKDELAPLLLEKNLEIPAEVSKSLSGDIIEKIVPLFSIDYIKEDNDENVDVDKNLNTLPLSVSEAIFEQNPQNAPPIKQKEESFYKKREESNIKNKKSIGVKKTNIDEKQEQTPKPTKPDLYRETIE